MSKDARRSLEQLLASAKTAEDLDAIETLATALADLQARTGSYTVEAMRDVAECVARKDRSDSFTVETLGQVADFFGLAEPTVRQWTARIPPVPGKAGAWPLKEIVKWRESWLTQAELKQKQAAQNYELGQVKLESERLELQQKRGELLHRDDVEHWAATAIVEFRETVMQLKEMLTSAAPPDMKDFVRSESDRHLRDALTAAARRLELQQIGDSDG